jgi:hypothetical protein
VHGKLVKEAYAGSLEIGVREGRTEAEKDWKKKRWRRRLEKRVREGGERGRKSFDFAECVVVWEIGADNGWKSEMRREGGGSVLQDLRGLLKFSAAPVTKRSGCSCFLESIV